MSLTNTETLMKTEQMDFIESTATSTKTASLHIHSSNLKTSRNFEFEYGDISLDNTASKGAQKTGSFAGLNLNKATAALGNNRVVQLLQSSSHPKVSFFHLLFKVMALGFYFYSWFVTVEFIGWFVPCVLSLAADFWVTKNISGRLLVGLRWWNEVNEKGDSTWRYENRIKKTGEEVNINDYRIFWYSMYFSTGIWALLTLWTIMRLQITGLLILSIALSLQMSNLIGYWRCYRDMEKKLESNLNSFIQNSAFNALRSSLFSSSAFPDSK